MAAVGFETPSRPAAASPGKIIPQSPVYLASAIAAAELRLSAAQKWASASQKLLEDAQSQVALSQIELTHARHHLERLQSEGSANNSTPSRAKSKNHDAAGAKLTTNLSGETDNETIIESASSSPLVVVRKVESASGSVTETKIDLAVEDAEKGASPKVAKPKKDDGAATEIESNNSDEGSETNSYEEFLSVCSSVAPSEASVTSSKMEEEEDKDKRSLVPAVKLSSTETDSEVGYKEIEVTGCGVPEINGKYQRFEKFDSVPSYARIAKYDGQEVMFRVSRWRANNGTRKWYITATAPGGDRPIHHAFYVAYAPSFFNYPPRKSWMVIAEGEELFLSPEYKGKGTYPVPAIVLENDDATSVSSKKSASMRISGALTSSSSRAYNNKKKRRKRRGKPRSTNENGSLLSLGSLGSLSTTHSHGKHRENGPPVSVYLPPSLLSV
ncbi:hypothetical protein ACHAWF_015968 [Thalassiosira exigua]